ncbi:hypothetical protein GCM10022198_19770 [Klugiella xanthotipulae]|uniref:Uncharacterized protein n=1 Tax=Klugiella xanthotipulae TaxID=244735 RepID=A0A543I3X3_9MICO|nr:hypothetical protein [Klugiella xanthotipulae]TQM65289.1 hypothetical protein FB466_0080 [Klugiella xanthotipulae]
MSSDLEHAQRDVGDLLAGDGGLVSRLTVIEEQPLATRAAAYQQIHTELRERLESGDINR